MAEQEDALRALRQSSDERARESEGRHRARLDLVCELVALLPTVFLLLLPQFCSVGDD